MRTVWCDLANWWTESMDLTVITPPATTSVDVAMLKANKRIRHASEDDLISFWCRAADEFIEKRTNTAVMAQNLRLRLSRILPVIRIPRPPLRSLTSIKYTPEGGSEVTVDTSGVRLVVEDMLAKIELPTLDAEAPGSMEIVYSAGYATPEDVPAGIRHAALLLAGHWTTSREAAFMDTRLMQVEKRIPFGVDAHLANHRVPNTNEPLNGGY